MNSETNLSKFFNYGIAIFPFLLLVGPLVSELFVILSIIYFLFFIFKENQFKFLLNKYLIFFGTFYLSVLFSTIFNFYHFNNTIGGLLYFRIPLCFSIWFILKISNFDKKFIFILHFSLY